MCHVLYCHVTLEHTTRLPVHTSYPDTTRTHPADESLTSLAVYFRNCKGYCGRADVERNTVLAGDPKVLRLLCNTNLNMNIPSRGSEEERIRIPCKYGLIYRVTDIINKTEVGKYVSVRVRYRVTWHASAALAEGRSEVMAGQEQ